MKVQQYSATIRSFSFASIKALSSHWQTIITESSQSSSAKSIVWIHSSAPHGSAIFSIHSALPRSELCHYIKELRTKFTLTVHQYTFSIASIRALSSHWQIIITGSSSSSASSDIIKAFMSHQKRMITAINNSLLSICTNMIKSQKQNVFWFTPEWGYFTPISK